MKLRAYMCHVTAFYIPETKGGVHVGRRNHVCQRGKGHIVATKGG